MGKIVAKFGGSSLSDAGQFHKVRDILQMDPRRCYVVPSAPGRRFDDDEKITDLLYRTYQLKEEGKDYHSTFALVRERFLTITKDLGLSLNMAGALEEIENRLEAGCGRDYCASRGEYLNGLILADFLGFPFLDPKDFVLFEADGSFFQ